MSRETEGQYTDEEIDGGLWGLHDIFRDMFLGMDSWVSGTYNDVYEASEQLGM